MVRTVDRYCQAGGVQRQTDELNGGNEIQLQTDELYTMYYPVCPLVVQHG